MAIGGNIIVDYNDNGRNDLPWDNDVPLEAQSLRKEPEESREQASNCNIYQEEEEQSNELNENLNILNMMYVSSALLLLPATLFSATLFYATAKFLLDYDNAVRVSEYLQQRSPEKDLTVRKIFNTSLLYPAAFIDSLCQRRANMLHSAYKRRDDLESKCEKLFSNIYKGFCTFFSIKKEAKNLQSGTNNVLKIT